MTDLVLIVWLLVDVAVSAAIFGFCSYLVFWRGNSGLWFIPALLLSGAFGGTNLYSRLNERVKRKP